MPRRFAFTRRPGVPRPLAPRRGHADHVPWGRLPARNEAIDQDGQRIVLKQCYKSAISADETREK